MMCFVTPLQQYMVASGNHERDWPGSGDAFGTEDSSGECGVVLQRRFAMPWAGAGGRGGAGRGFLFGARGAAQQSRGAKAPAGM
jgi:hypothetical protein